MPASLVELEAERCRRSLLAFVQGAWPVVEPGSAFVLGVHILEICKALEAVARGEILRLIINVPPRHGKSLLTSVFFPTWLWIDRPELRFMYASYAGSLSVRDSLRCRRLIESPWYQERFGGCFALTADQNMKSRFENERGGVRIATSVGGAATGEGGDLIVIDDPHKIEEASSAAARLAVHDWFDFTVSTRLNDPAAGAIVVIMQRLHQEDLTGHLLGQGGWTQLCLPAEYDPAHPYLWPGDPRTEPGELLWSERFNQTAVEQLKQTLGSYGAAGQLQQLPAPAGGGILQASWFRFYEPSQPPAGFDLLLQSWDLSYSGAPGADYVVGQLWGTVGPNKYLIRQIRKRMHFTETLAAIEQLTSWADDHYPRHRGHAILGERAANGEAVIDTLRRRIPSVIPIRPQGNKRSRAEAVAPQLEAGNVYLPGARDSRGSIDRAHTPLWVQALIDEAARFPNGSNDDQVDALTQALLRLTKPEPRLRILSA